MNALRPYLLLCPLMMACSFSEEQQVLHEDGRPCATQSREPALTNPIGDPSMLVEGLNSHAPILVEFRSSDTDIPAGVVVSDTVVLRLSADWTAEYVVYADPVLGVCPDSDDRLEVHGMLTIGSEEGLSYKVPVLISSPTDNIRDAALVLWSDDVDDGRVSLPNPAHPLPKAYAEIDADFPDDGGPRDLLGFYVTTEGDLAGTLGDGAVFSLSTYDASRKRSSGFLRSSFEW